MEIIVGKNAGFCYGVKNAVDKSEEEVKKGGKICCLGEIVHNGKVVMSLEDKGLRFIDNLSENTDFSKTIIRAHGVSKDIYEEAEAKGIELVDLTCPNVLRIHKIVSEYEKKGFFIVVIGNRVHPETVGTVGFCGEHYCVIENEDEIESSIIKFNESKKRDLLIIVQTTFSLEKFNRFVDIIKNSVNDEMVNIEVCNSICNATKVRQEETAEISKKVDFMVIIGGKNSSNTKKLFEIASQNCKKVICIEDATEIELEDFKSSNVVGIMAGASTPQSSIKEVEELLKNT